MQTWIGLLRGINMAGKNKIKMQELREIIQHPEIHHLQTYIQSGNLIFQTGLQETSQLSSHIRESIHQSHGFAPQTILIKADLFHRLAEENPFPDAIETPQRFHLFFLERPPTSPDIERMESVQTPTERFHLTPEVLYLHTPDGFGRSKLSNILEKALGVPATARNWNTVNKLREMTHGF